jgi:hypothetical protein
LTSPLRTMRLAAIGALYVAMGTGVFAGCGDPSLQSQQPSSESPASTSKAPTGAQSSLTSSTATGMRHASEDQQAVSRTSGAATATHLGSPETVASCSESDYASGDQHDKAHAVDSGQKAPCGGPR